MRVKPVQCVHTVDASSCPTSTVAMEVGPALQRLVQPAHISTCFSLVNAFVLKIATVVFASCKRTLLIPTLFLLFLLTAEFCNCQPCNGSCEHQDVGSGYLHCSLSPLPCFTVLCNLYCPPKVATNCLNGSHPLTVGIKVLLDVPFTSLWLYHLRPAHTGNLIVLNE